MKKIGILLENLFDEQELIYPYHRLREDFEVHLIGTEKDTEYKSKAGFGIKSTHASKDANPEDYEGLVIPGGYSPDHMRRSEDTKALIKAIYDADKPVAAICHAAWAVVSSIDVKGKNMTSFPSVQDDVKNAGATWLDEEVVVDGNLITSRNPKDLPAFMKAFIEQVK